MTWLDSGGQKSKVKVTAGHQGQILWTPYLVNYLSSLNETYREWPLAFTDDLVRFGRWKVKVRAGRRGGEGICVDSGASKLIFCLQFL